MTSETDATYQQSTILSANDPRINQLEHRAGDKFLFSPKEIKEYSKELVDLFHEQRVVCEVQGYILFDEGDIGYCMGFEEPRFEFQWGVRASDLEDFMYLGENYEEARFVFIDE